MSVSANLRFDAKDLSIRFAQREDVKRLALLINAAFRVEQPFIEGDRTNPDVVHTYMQKGKFLLAEDSRGLAGCVYVELRGDRGYLGLLGVDPPRQGTGLGRKLMAAVENYFREAGCRAVDLRIVSSAHPAPGLLSSPRLCGNRHCSFRPGRPSQSSVPLHPDVEEYRLKCQHPQNSNIPFRKP
jgi:ribosomal protein S18 acetylase RimI-like enzyme